MHTRSILLRVAAPALVALCAAAPAARAGVLVVDLAGGGDYTNVDTAVSAAADGDIVLIKPGNYLASSFFVQIEGKGLVLVGDSGGSVILPPLFVSGIPAGKTVVLRHLEFQPNGIVGLLGGTVALGDNPGRVHIEDCTIAGLNGAPQFLGTSATPGIPGLRSFSSAALAVHRSTITGGTGVSTTAGVQFVTSAGGSAIEVNGVPLSLHQVTATGGGGGSGAATGANGGHGGHGLNSANSPVIVSGCTLIGGNGGSAGVGMTPGGSGSGVWTGGVGVSISELDSSLIGGSGAPGLLQLSGTHDVWTGEAWSLAISGPVRSGSVGSITATGPPSEAFGLFFSLGMGYLPKASFRGAFLPGSPFFGPLIIATTNSNGVWTAPFVAPSLLPFGLEGLLNIDQALMMQDAGLVLSSATAYIQVEPPN